MDAPFEARLPVLSQRTVAWAHATESEWKTKGKPLAFWQVHDALDVGVREPKRVRVCLVDAMPPITEPELFSFAEETGFLHRDTRSLTIGYVIFMRREQAGQRALLRHALRHVAQFEMAGGLRIFIPTHLKQIVGL